MAKRLLLQQDQPGGRSRQLFPGVSENLVREIDLNAILESKSHLPVQGKHNGRAIVKGKIRTCDTELLGLGTLGEESELL